MALAISSFRNARIPLKHISYMFRAPICRAIHKDIQFSPSDLVRVVQELNHESIKVTEMPDGKHIIDISLPQHHEDLTKNERVRNLVDIIDGYFNQGGHHLNLVLHNRATLLHAIDHPEMYPSLTIRVSGYAVHFVRLTREQQLEVIARTFHDTM